MSDKGHASIIHAPQGEITRMHPVVERAMAHNPTPETLRELLAVQREWEAGEAKKAFTRALVELKRDLPVVIARDSVVDFTSQKGRTHYTHTSLAAAVEAVTEPVTRHGFSVAWVPSTSPNSVSVTCRLTHKDGHSEETTITAPPDTSGSKSPAQAVASTITLLSRYTMLSLLGIATADMDDPRPSQQAKPDPERIDADRNLRAAGRLRKLGIEVAEAEQYLSKRVSEWTGADIDAIKSWAEKQEQRA